MRAADIVTFLVWERKRQHKTKKSICNVESENGYHLNINTLCNYENKLTEPSLTRTCLWARALGYELALVKTKRGNKVKIKLDSGAVAPTRAHDTDAGLDIRAMYDGVIGPHSNLTFHTGVHVQLPPGTCGILVSKSGLNVKFDMTSTGLIDEGYEGEILVKLYNHGNKYVNIRRGDKISQLVVIPCMYESVELVDELEHNETGRGSNGFGSTGR